MVRDRMSPKKRMLAVFNGDLPDRVPFVPTIYEHAAYLIDRSPSEVAQDADLIAKAHLKAYETYQYDFISVGIDIYGVEPEVLGCGVEFPESGIPSVSTHVLADKDDCSEIVLPNPETDGRMPLYLEAAESVAKEVGSEVLVSGTVIGPFTLAALLRGFEQFIMDAIYSPEFFEKLMGVSYKVAKTYAEAFIKRNVGVTLNESWCSPPLVSPRLYAESIEKYHRALMDELKEKGVRAGLVIGGNTQPIFDELVKAGASVLIADYGCDVARCKELAMSAGVTLRANVDPKLVHDGPPEAIYQDGQQICKIGAPGGRFLLGMGVVPYDTPTENVLVLKEVACEWPY